MSADHCAIRAKILVTDDVPELRNILADYLSACGHETTTAANGEEALALLRERRTDILVTDFNMPKLDGIGLIKALYADGIELKGIVLISGGQRPQQKEAFARFVRDYPHPVPFQFLDKPLEAQSLCAVIQTMMASSSDKI